MDENSINKNYHYIPKNGVVTGPVSKSEIENLLSKNEIDITTLIWDGQGDWKTIKDTGLAEDISSSPPPPPPPPPNNHLNSNSNESEMGLNNKLAWGIALSGFLGVILGLIAYIVAVVIAFIDYRKCKEKRVEISPKWMVFIPILYLWKRSKVFEDNKRIFWVGCIGMVVFSLFIIAQLDDGFGSSAVEEEACTQVTSMVRFSSYITSLDEFGGDSIECERVKISYEIADNTYSAIAILNTGDAVDITIRTDGDQVKTTIDR